MKTPTTKKRKFLGRRSDEAIGADALDTIPWSGGFAEVTLDCAEFTSHCPVTGQPDFGRLSITYLPREVLLETKGVKLYLWSFRDAREFNEAIVSRIADELFLAARPNRITVRGAFNHRGGIAVTCEALRAFSQECLDDVRRRCAARRTA